TPPGPGTAPAPPSEREGTTLRALLRPHGTLADLCTGRANSFGAVRLLLAVAVVVSHVYPLGWGRLDPLWNWSGHQTDFGKSAVLGFFALSGFMITGSAAALSPLRFAWHRALRILPGLWGSLLVCALALVPLLYFFQHGSLTGFWNRPDGPLSYLSSLGSTSPAAGWDISGVLAEGIRRSTNFDRSLNGALWSLKYEILCYALAGLLAALGLLRGRLVVPALALALWLMIAGGLADLPSPGSPLVGPGVAVPVLGQLSGYLLVHLGFVFLLGAGLRLWADRIPVDDRLALAAGIVLAGTLYWRGYPVLGHPALVYLLFWAAARLPRRFQAVGRRHDYSYGVYIYGFPVEQAAALLGFARFGVLGFFAAAMTATLALAAFSWHVVEEPAMRLRNWAPGPRGSAEGARPAKAGS
ncbi:acyltransferase family protein, partial [Kitasatospora sp. NPDC058406]|uniref:acyltransferase family protein n=1 Tax=Kitasatospora sp. NPDC058406 TaxID=3346483 RepID=UPI00365F10C6